MSVKKIWGIFALCIKTIQCFLWQTYNTTLFFYTSIYLLYKYVFFFGIHFCVRSTVIFEMSVCICFVHDANCWKMMEFIAIILTIRSAFSHNTHTYTHIDPYIHTNTQRYIQDPLNTSITQLYEQLSKLASKNRI